MVCSLQNGLISPEAAELIAAGIYEQGSMRRLAAQLPEDDEELHRWLEGASEAMDECAFTMLFSAAAVGGRRLQASLVTAAMALRIGAWNLAWVAWRMKGDVAGELLRGLERVSYVQTEGRALALFVAAAWWKEHRAEQPVPAQVLHLAAALSEEEKLDAMTVVLLQDLAILLGETKLAHQRIRRGMPMTLEKQRKQLDKIFALLHGPYERFLYEKMPLEYSGRLPLRRAVERIGRNEICRCGSGQKYKRCCHARDRERLRRCSSLAGLTRDEIDEPRTGVLTEERLQLMGPAVMQLDPAQVPEELQSRFIVTLIVVKQYEAVIAAFRKLGVPERLRDVWSEMFEQAAQAWRPDLARQLMEVFPDAEEKLGQKPQPAIRLLLVGDDPAKFLETLESELRILLETRDSEEFQSLMWTVMESPYRALGIVMARSILPLAEDKFVPGLFEGILAARAKLNLSPEDEFSAWMDKQALRKSRKHETATAQETRDKLAAKMAELRKTQEKLAQVDRELALRARQERRELEAKPSASADEQAAREIAELKADRKRLQGQLSQNGEERLALRRKLETAEREKEALKAEASAPEPSKTDDEDFQVEGHQPVRLLEFPRGFTETLAAFPRHVGRATMNRLGRIASGEPGAFERVKQLKAYPEVLRARVADKHRLLFCLTPDRVRVVDLIRRADLDRRIERLQASGLPPVA